MASQFIDNLKRPWVVSITIGAVARARKMFDIDLAQPIPMIEQQDGDAKAVEEQPLLTKLALDLELLGNVLYALVYPQCNERHVSQEEFLDALDGDVFKVASDTFWREYADFFRRIGREPLAEAVESMLDMIQKSMDQLLTVVKGAEKIADQKITELANAVKEDRLTEILGNSFGTPQEQLASIQGN